MSGRCERGPASPLAERAGYVPRVPAPELGYHWFFWCRRPCVGCGELTCNDNLLCRECDLDVLQDVMPMDEAEAKRAAATAPFGVCGARP